MRVSLKDVVFYVILMTTYSQRSLFFVLIFYFISK